MSSSPAGNQVVVRFDSARNRLEIVYHGVIGSSGMAKYEEEIRSAIGQLKSDFHLLTDLSAIVSMDSGCIPYIERSMDAINRGGVGRIVRVIPHTSKDIGLSIMSLFHYRHGLRIITCLTREEAEQALL
ncbi:MAG TPA: hypothetical protein VIM69_02210 [Opitutaceae bacterium]